MAIFKDKERGSPARQILQSKILLIK